jgi:twinkle protein
MSIFNSKISAFKSTLETQKIKKDLTIESWLKHIRDGTYKNQILKIREGNSELKKQLPTIAFHGIFNQFRKAVDFEEASGLIILDIDDINPEDDLEDIKSDIMSESNHVLAVMTSPSGNGLKVLYYVDQFLITVDNYRNIGKQLVDNFAIYGKVDYLSVTDCLIVTWDEKIVINYDVTPAFIYFPEPISKNSVLEERDFSIDLWDNVEDFFDTVLAKEISDRTNSNFHYIQVAVLDLAKFGFHHPNQDLSFVINYAEENFKYSKDNKTRFLEVVEVAKQVGHTKWAYKFFQDDEEEVEFDYSEYKETSVLSHDKNKVDIDYLKEKTIESNGLICYSGLFEKVLSTAKEGDRVGSEISLKSFSNIFRFKGTGILTVTGIPGFGKSEFMDQCILDLARLYGHETILAGFEQTPEEHIVKLVRKLLNCDVTCATFIKDESNIERFKLAYDFIVSKIKHIDTTTIGGNIMLILECAAKQIKLSRDNGGDPKYLVLDPFNMLSIKGKLSGHEKIEEILRSITQFSHQMGVMAIVVAHPFKMRKDEKTKTYEIPDFYSVKGSSAFYEMSYHGLVIHRTGYMSSDPVLVKVLKVKQSNLGITAGEVNFFYDKNSGRYLPIDEDGNEESGDHRDSDWLEKAIELKNN